MDMTSVLSLFAFGMSVLVFITYLRRKSRESNSISPSQRESQIQYLQTHWKQVRVKADDCDVLKYDRVVDKQAIGGEEGLFELRRFGIFPDEADWKTEKRSRILYRCKDLGNEKNYEVIVGKDAEIIEIKLYLQGYIDIYENPSNSKEYFFDLRFLDKSVDELK